MTFRQRLWIAIRWQWRWGVFRTLAKDHLVDVVTALGATLIAFLMAAFLLVAAPFVLVWNFSGHLIYAALVWPSDHFERLQERMPGGKYYREAKGQDCDRCKGSGEVVDIRKGCDLGMMPCPECKEAK